MANNAAVVAALRSQVLFSNKACGRRSKITICDLRSWAQSAREAEELGYDG
jgi:hypothetical protein